jgi:hypothetical protein
MTKRQATNYMSTICKLRDQEGNKRFDSPALHIKPQSSRTKRYAISVHDSKTGHTLSFQTGHEAAQFLKQQRVKRAASVRRLQPAGHK